MASNTVSHAVSRLGSCFSTAMLARKVRIVSRGLANSDGVSGCSVLAGASDWAVAPPMPGSMSIVQSSRVRTSLAARGCCKELHIKPTLEVARIAKKQDIRMFEAQAGWRCFLIRRWLEMRWPEGCRRRVELCHNGAVAATGGNGHVSVLAGVTPASGARLASGPSSRRNWQTGTLAPPCVGRTGQEVGRHTHGRAASSRRVVLGLICCRSVGMGETRLGLG